MGFFHSRYDHPKTAIHVALANNENLSFNYPRWLGNKEAHDLLDPILEELRGCEFAGPIEIHRYSADGRRSIEVVGLLSVDD